jgi:hypothetical protein
MTDQSSMAKQRTDWLDWVPLLRSLLGSPRFAIPATGNNRSKHRWFTIRKRSVVPVCLLQSCSSVRRVVERNEIYTLVCGKTFFGCHARFSPANLPEPRRAIVGVVAQLFLRRSFLQTIQTNNILAFPPFLPLGRSSLRNINRPEFPQSKLPLLYLLPPYLHCSSSTSIATHMNSEWWVCSKWMSLDLLRRLCINSVWSMHTTAQSYVRISWGKIHSKRDMHLSCNCVQLAWIAHHINKVPVSSLVMSHIFDTQCNFNLSTWYMSASESK